MLISKIILLRYSYIVAATVVDIVMVPFLMVGLFYLMRGVKLPQRIVSSAFAIYLMHQTFLLFSIVIVTVINLRGSMDVSIGIWLARFVFAVFISLVIACCLRKFFPSVTNLLLGGR